jgi:hypothetical protein
MITFSLKGQYHKKNGQTHDVSWTTEFFSVCPITGKVGLKIRLTLWKFKHFQSLNGTVQRKLIQVISSINRQLMTCHCSDR